MIRNLILIVSIFVGFVGLWYLYDNQGITAALFPIAIPAYLFWVFGGGTWFIAIPLFLYAMVLVILFAWLKKHAKKKKIILTTIGVLVIVHLFCYRLMIRAFEQLGAGIGKQILQEK